MRTPLRASLCLVVLATCLVSGCGASASKVNGKIVKGGQPFTISEKGVFVLSFVPADNPTAGTIYNATTNRDGTFTIVGPTGKGIPAGKYKVQLAAMDPYPATDLLGGKFAPNSPSAPVVDIGSGELVIDVSK